MLGNIFFKRYIFLFNGIEIQAVTSSENRSDQKTRQNDAIHSADLSKNCNKLRPFFSGGLFLSFTSATTTTL
jgi:hypothetical protein